MEYWCPEAGSAANRHSLAKTAMRSCRKVLTLGSVFCASLVMLCASFGSSPLAQGSQVGREESSSGGPVPLNTRSGLSELLHPENVRLGTFAIDLGLADDGDSSSVQRNYALASILSDAVSVNLQRISNYSCNLILTADMYPLLQGFMYRSNQSGPSDQVRAICVEDLKQILLTEQFDEGLIRKQVEMQASDLRRRSAAAAHRDGPFSLGDAMAGVGEALRRIYDERSTVHALISVDADQFASITPEAFHRWLQEIRSSGRLRFLTEDPDIRRQLGMPEADQVVSLPPMPMSKKSTGVLELREFDTPSIRAAVLVAIDPPRDGRVNNEAVAKHCGRWNPNADLDAAEDVAHLRSACSFHGVFGREAWVAFFFRSDGGPDDLLRHAVADIAADPVVAALAARRSDGGRIGRPYVVWFGGNQR